jgi:hypothetical protein
MRGNGRHLSGAASATGQYGAWCVGGAVSGGIKSTSSNDAVKFVAERHVSVVKKTTNFSLRRAGMLESPTRHLAEVGRS